MNLVGVCNSKDKNVIWNFLKKYDDSLDPKKNKLLVSDRRLEVISDIETKILRLQ